MQIFQQEITLRPRSRGFHLITQEIESSLRHTCLTGIAHIHLKHTSASLTLNENADPSVRNDFEHFINHLVLETFSYTHEDEGRDDMPAHIKSSLFGVSLTLPITHGRFNLGT